MAIVPGTDYQMVLDAVAGYYGSGSDQWLEIARHGLYADGAVEILKQVPGVQVTVADSGKVLNFSYKVAEAVNDGGTAASVINSNIQSGTAAAGSNLPLNINSTMVADAQTGELSIVSGAKTASVGTQVLTTAKTVGTAIAAVGAGARAGVKIADTLYDLNPDFWDDNGMGTLDPSTWSTLVTDLPDTGIEGVYKKGFNMLFGFNDQAQAVTPYLDEAAVAYLLLYMQEQGAFSGGGFQPSLPEEADSAYYSSILSDVCGYQRAAMFYKNSSGAAQVNRKDESVIFTSNTWAVPLITGSGTHSLFNIYIGQQNSSVNFTRNLYEYVNNTWTMTSSTNYSITADTELTYKNNSGGTIRTGIYFGYRSFNSKISSYSPYFDVSPITTTTVTGTGSSIINDIALYFAFGTTTPSIEGITQQDGATVPDLSSATTPFDALARLKQQYPDWWDDAIEQSVVQPDGSVVTDTYIPIAWPGSIPTPEGWPEGTPYDGLTYSTQPATGDGGTQADPSVTPQSSPDVLDVILPFLVPQANPVTGDVTGDGTGQENPPDTGSGTTPTVTVPDGSASALFSVYHPTQAQLNSFGSWLWSSNFVDQLLKMFNDPMQAIIGLHKVFVTPSIGGSSTIHVGYLDSGVASETVDSQYTTVDCGEINCAEYFGNVFDYGPFTDIDLYLPFVGIVPLSVDDVMRSRIRVIYHVDVLTGAALVDVKVLRDGDAGGILYQYSGNCAVQYPLSSGSYMGIVSTIASLAGSVAATALTGGAAPLLIGAAAGLMGGSASTRVSKSGSFAGNPGAMGAKIPYLIISRPQTALADSQEQYIGQPAHKTVTIGSLSGYTKLLEVHLEGIPATGEELQEIEALLKEGVIL